MYLIKMNDINDYLTTSTGIFKAIYNTTSQPFTWLSEDLADTLDLDYYLSHSGNKYISPIVIKLYDNDNTTYLTKLAKIIILKYSDKWNRIYKAYIQSDYEPLENYSLTESESVNTDVTTQTDGANNVFGFNTTSEDGIPSSLSGVTQNTTGDKTKNTRDLMKYGNVGVTTSQQMLSSEIELRAYNFYNEIMNDVDAVMCLDIRGVNQC